MSAPSSPRFSRWCWPRLLAPAGRWCFGPPHSSWSISPFSATASSRCCMAIAARCRRSRWSHWRSSGAMRDIGGSVAEVADDLSSHKDRPEPDLAAEADDPLERISKAETALSPEEDAARVPERWRERAAVLCIPGTGLIDEAAAIALAQLLERRGIGARAKEADALSMGKLCALDTNNVALVCLCYLGKASAAQI